MNATTRDFPDWLGPMLVKELRQGLKARAFVLSFVALQALLVLTVIMSTLNYARDPVRYSPSSFTGFFWMLLGLQLLVVTPLRAMNALAGERKANTLELIFMTSLTSWRIAFGKWASLLFQAALFVLAVLPYAILRYFFGGVNLTEELWLLGTIVGLSALLTAIALAISGMPVFVRGIVFVIAAVFGMQLVPALLFGGMMGGRMGISFGGGFGGVTWEPEMTLILLDAALLCVAALEVAGATIAPPAENHALRQRLLAFAAWLPVPVLLAFQMNEAAIFAQLAFFTALAGLSCWHDFARQPMLLHNQVEPFVRRGRLATLAGRVCYPGWPGALLFFIGVQILMLGSWIVLWRQTNVAASSAVRLFFRSAYADTDAIRMFAALLMGGAALLTPPLILGRRTRARLPLLEQTLVQLFGGIVALFATQGLEIYDKQLGDYLWFAIFPPAGQWAIMTARNTMILHWLLPAALAFALTLILMLARAIPHWRQLRALEREIRNGAPEPAGVAAAP